MSQQGVFTRFLEAISDPIRMQIVFLLHDEAELNVGEIASRFRVSRPAISHHLRILKDADIVLSEKRGQENYYWLDSQRMVTTLRALADKLERTAVDKAESP
ncbi:ArsR family transcriptional regulator [Ktedonosporobacter rubrisoli]|uniref:ArsR family transcriptional regulator n=1 Tax=Ktedonosporobacter rubrisoli TaxID=2509675 RepID=A0A4P6JZS9_KTERU|nr:metalloregulator ArsR/SmtB family transcription factor [Ktedonosporobacter rubrisoli]QBD80900.1 ArsR family transcriptional regulator [Ktedonosporobacter rubrisoli]